MYIFLGTLFFYAELDLATVIEPTRVDATV
jgi:hypothetical protein